MKVSRSKRRFFCKELRYLGSTVQCNGGCGSEMKRRVQADWNNWRRVSGVICGRRLSACAKGKVYKTVVIPAMHAVWFGDSAIDQETRSRASCGRVEDVRFSLGVTTMDKIKNEFIRGTAQVRQMGDKVREARLRWYGHMQRQNTEYIGKRMLCLELPGKRRRETEGQRRGSWMW